MSKNEFRAIYRGTSLIPEPNSTGVAFLMPDDSWGFLPDITPEGEPEGSAYYVDPNELEFVKAS